MGSRKIISMKRIRKTSIRKTKLNRILGIRKGLFCWFVICSFILSALNVSALSENLYPLDIGEEEF
jgi:hypothetical protein